MDGPRKGSCHLPKLDSKYTTRLSEDMKSTTGYDFDFTCPSEYWHYNPLRDPHLKMYFNRPHMLKRLIRRKCISSDLKVLCQSEEEFKLYKQFLSDEALKNTKRKETFEALEMDEENSKKSKKNKVKKNSTKKRHGISGRTRRTITKSRKTFYKMQEKKLRHKMKDLKELQQNFKVDKIKAIVHKFIHRKLGGLKKTNKMSLSELMSLISSYDSCKDLRKKRELSSKLRTIQLQRMKEAESIRTLVELEVLWKKHGDYACKAHQDSLRILKNPAQKCTKEAQGALLFSYLTQSLLQQCPSTASISDKVDKEVKKVKLPPLNHSSQSLSLASRKGRPSPDWYQWVQRQREQMSLQLKRERETWHDKRHELFNILWKDVPSEAEQRRCGQLRTRQKQHLPPFGNLEEKREKARSVFFGKDLEWQRQP